ncbi:MAG TPA: hypothetical protein VMH83_11850 [Candidatus Acidoferrum sp.]|nr:hypothetical protein [Candidatus Acidoferrum sp.]
MLHISLKNLFARVACMTLLVCARLHAQQVAEINGNFFALGSVKVGNDYYYAELSRARAGLNFQVSKAVKLDNAPAQPSATFADNLVDVPDVTIGNAEYRLQLQLVTANPLVFKLKSATMLAATALQDGSLVVPVVPQDSDTGYAALPNGRGGMNYEPVLVDTGKGFDKARSLAAFQQTLYPYLRSNGCATCHNSDNPTGTGAQAPMHSDSNVALAHEYALTRVNFADPVNSKFVVRMGIDRHNCPQSDCAQAAADMLAAVKAWKSQIADMLQEAPRLVAADTKIAEADVVQWIADDKATLDPADRDYIIYTSMHELHNEGLSADELNIVRAALSKALNSVARWAPAIVNPVDVNGKGILYKFDIRDYWGWNKGVTRLLFGGSDDDLAFSQVPKYDYRGIVVNCSTCAVQSQRYNYAQSISWDPAFSKTIWERVLHGNVEGANISGSSIKPYIDGFRGKRSSNLAGEYIAPADFQWVETAQLIYTLTRPDVYNAIMMLPMYTDQIEDELGVDKSKGLYSYDYVTVFDAITVDSRLLWRADMKDGGSFWKTFDVFTGQLSTPDRSIFDVYRDAGTDIRFPWWANPVPKFVDWNATTAAGKTAQANTYSFVASLAEPFGTAPTGCDPQPNYSGIQGFYNCRHYTGTGGLQQSAEEMIWSLPNGLQGYMLAGAFNQRRVDAFTNIVRDPRLIPNAKDNIASQTGFSFGKNCDAGVKYCAPGGFNDPRLNTGSSCIACHTDGMNRMNNNLRDWVDEQSIKLPAGPYGVDGWINNQTIVDQVKQMYPPSSELRPRIETARKTFLDAMAQVRDGMVLGDDKNLHVEPIIWTVEYVQRKKYKYPQTTSN